jgi:hypothetical protein
MLAANRDGQESSRLSFREQAMRRQAQSSQRDFLAGPSFGVID